MGQIEEQRTSGPSAMMVKTLGKGEKKCKWRRSEKRNWNWIWTRKWVWHCLQVLVRNSLWFVWEISRALHVLNLMIPGNPRKHQRIEAGSWLLYRTKDSEQGTRSENTWCSRLDVQSGLWHTQIWSLEHWLACMMHALHFYLLLWVEGRPPKSYSIDLTESIAHRPCID